VFSDRIKVQSTPLYGGGHAFIIDNALADPAALVRFSARTRNAFARSAFPPDPGIELQLTGSFNAKFDNFFRLHIRQYFDARRTIDTRTRLSLATLKPTELRATQCLPHRSDYGLPTDESLVCCTLYLFEDETLGGTAFYAPKLSPSETRKLVRDCSVMNDADFAARYPLPRAYCTASNQFFELARIVPAKYNRLVFYDGAAFNAAHLKSPEKLNDDPGKGRLTLNGFFRCKRNAKRLADRRRG
jgi:Family of unknown function (DUF6445)